MRSLRVGLLICGTALGSVGLAGEELARDLETLLKQGRGTTAGRAAWERLASARPADLPALLRAMNTSDTSAANWVRTAFDVVVERALKTDRKQIDVEGLLKVVHDTQCQGRVRRLALELVDRLSPGTSTELYPGWLNDPEFRYEAVALTLAKAAKLAKAKERDDALALYRQAFDASRDVLQARAAAAGLNGLGASVSVGRHLGFLMDWYVVGPFDGKGQQGPRLMYPPEKGMDLRAQYAGQNGKVRWRRYQAREPAPTSNARHQALVDLREKEALGDADDAVAFAYTELTVPAAREVEFRGAADDNFTVYVNGVPAFAFEEWRNGVRHDRHRFKVRLKEGKNSVLVKICQTPAPNPEPNWEFFLRVVDATGKGIPFSNALPDEKK